MADRNYLSFMKQDTGLTGAAGEHLVLSRLLARGVLAAQAPRGSRKADILVNHLDDGGSLLIQVKTLLDIQKNGWHMQEKHEHIRDEDMLYCFVDLRTINAVVYVVPAKIVAEVVASSHQIWLGRPGQNGKPHKDMKMRWIKPKFEFPVPKAPDGWMDEYKEKWELLSK